VSNSSVSAPARNELEEIAWGERFSVAWDETLETGVGAVARGEEAIGEGEGVEAACPRIADAARERELKGIDSPTIADAARERELKGIDSELREVARVENQRLDIICTCYNA
jgi:hypothetical protein